MCILGYTIQCCTQYLEKLNKSCEKAAKCSSAAHYGERAADFDPIFVSLLTKNYRSDWAHKFRQTVSRTDRQRSAFLCEPCRVSLSIDFAFINILQNNQSSYSLDVKIIPPKKIYIHPRCTFLSIIFQLKRYPFSI